jgi:3-oxoacyl-[acyl-carrier protein] reductase
MIDTGLKNKVVLITGVNNPHGIGVATAKAFTTEGAAVFVTYLRLPAEASTTNVPGEAFYHAQNARIADEVINAIRERGGKIEAWEANLADPAVITF